MYDKCNQFCYACGLFIDNSEDCYFRRTNIDGHHYKTRNRIQYANVLTTRPVPRGSQDKPAATENPENPPESSDENSPREKNDEPYIPIGTRTTERHLMSNQDYNDLVRDLVLSSRQTEILA